MQEKLCLGSSAGQGPVSMVGKAWCFRLELATHMLFLLGCSVGQDSWKEECF